MTQTSGFSVESKVMADRRLQAKGEDHRIRQRLIEAAAVRLTQQNYHDELIDDIAVLTGYPTERVRVYFQTSEDVVVALYARFANDLESRIMDLPEGTLGERFRALMEIKFEIIEPYRKTLAGLVQKLSNRKSKLGVLSRETEAIRVRVRGVLAETIEGATDHGGRSTDHLSQNLYSIYLAVMWLWFRDTAGSRKRAEMLLRAVCGAMSFSAAYLSKPYLRSPLGLLASIQRSFLVEEDSEITEKSSEILRLLFKYRRLYSATTVCKENPCARCLALHIPKTSYFISADRPIHLILPAFPAKSPNPGKTLGPMPDMAEEQALLFLAKLCSDVKAVYPPGLRLTICSDGHVFSDLVGVSDEDVTSYGAAISLMIERLGLSEMIDTFSLGDLYEDINIDGMRASLNINYEQTLESIRDRAAKVHQAGMLINGIHRFLFEDSVELDTNRSRTQIRNECRNLAYQVVQRSDGWGRLLYDCFPMALRLSIHPQEPHSDKIGILLGESDDVWLTPWHAVAVKKGDGFKLMKRREAELRGAKLTEAGGYYEL